MSTVALGLVALTLPASADPVPLGEADAADAPDRGSPRALLPLPETVGGQGIVRGQREPGYPSAVGLGLAGQTICTGSLIAPRVILTAAHCSGGYPVDVIVQFARAFVGDDARDPEAVLAFSGGETHPDYVPLSYVSLPLNDVAVLFLEEDAPVDPVWIRTEPLKPREDAGSEVVSVGWGVDEANVAGVKRSASLVVSEIDPEFLVSFSADNEGGANVCSGDSGGPMYHVEEDGTLIQWAVHSWADAGCASQSGSTRVDRVSGWVLDQVEAEHGSRDRCEVFGLYDDGVCHTDCEQYDRDCFELEAPLLVPGGCATGGPSAGAGALLIGILAVPFRRRPARGSKGADATEVRCARSSSSPPSPAAPRPLTSTARSCPTTAC